MSGFFPKGAILTGFGEPLTLFKEVKSCERCGCGALYWHKHYGKWRLHHYAALPGEARKFIAHQCGKKADGTTSEKYPWPRLEQPKAGAE